MNLLVHLVQQLHDTGSNTNQKKQAQGYALNLQNQVCHKVHKRSENLTLPEVKSEFNYKKISKRPCLYAQQESAPK